MTISISHAQTAVEINGKLKLVGNQLSSECGNAVQLRGMSTHGLQWYGNCVNNSAFTSLKNNWNADIVRLAMYVDEGGYLTDPNGYKTKIDTWIDQIGALGMYCLIDWHSLNPGDPNTHTTEAKDFWNYISAKHKGKKHVLYEICNEPNGVTWGTIKNFANQIIPVIRANDPETIIIVGTPQWSGKPGDVVSGGSLTSPNAYNVMYTFHFYASSHASYRPEVQKAAGSIPIFATEWGLSDASGGGSLNLAEGQLWMDIFNGNNDGKQKISWCNWSFSDKSESSAALNPGSCASSSWTNTTASGTQVKSWISSPAKNFISCTTASVVTSGITSPANNASFNKGTNITITASAATTQGTITKVEFFEGATLLGTSTNSPYSISISTLALGSHSITSKATDSNGSTATSPPVAVTVNNSVVTSSITSPANNASFNQGASITISASAATTQGSITKVEFFEGATLLGTSTSSPFSISISTLAPGSHNITAKATDSNGSTATSTPVSIVVNNSVVSSSIISPANNASFNQGTSITITASAATTQGSITKVEFFEGATLLGTSTSSPFSISISTLVPGSHNITAKATDSNGSTSTSTPVSIVVNNSVVTSSIISPANNSSIVTGNGINVNATASTTSGSITKIEFYVDNVLSATDVSSPYQFSTGTNLSVGSHILSIKAFDSNNSVNSQSISITVINSPLTLDLTSPTNADYTIGTDIIISADASTTVGSISKLEFYIDGTLMGSDFTTPYSYTATGLNSGSHIIYAKAFDSNNNTSVTTSKTINLYTPVYKVTNAPIVDGNIDVIWKNSSIPTSYLTKTIVNTSVGASDLSGSFKTLWDNNYIYVLGDITDDLKNNDSPEAYNDDAVEVYLDINNDKATTYGTNDAQYTFGWNDGTIVASLPGGHSITGITYSIADKPGGYIFEARIPWSALAASPMPGHKVGFDFMINDDDDGGLRDGKMSWNSTTDNAYQDPSLFGTVILMDALPCPLPGNAGNILGNHTICSQSTGQVFSISSVPNANGYNWVLPAGYTITNGLNTTVITVSLNSGATSGPISVTPTNNCGNGLSSTLAIQVNSLPFLSINSTKNIVCQGDAVTLTGSGASAYAFDNGVKNEIPFIPDITKSYQMTGTDVNGCQKSISTSIIVNARPGIPVIVAPTPLCNNVSNDFTISSSVKGSVYNWTATSSTNIAGQNSPKASITFKTGLTSADVTVTETNSLNCTSSAGRQTVFFTSCTLSGISESDIADQLKIFPNPFQNNINISLGSLAGETSKIELTDIEGKIVGSREKNMLSDQNTLGENLQAGQYILRIITEYKVIVRSVIKIQ